MYFAREMSEFRRNLPHFFSERGNLKPDIKQF